jgi:hypothetical protein
VQKGLCGADDRLHSSDIKPVIVGHNDAGFTYGHSRHGAAPSPHPHGEAVNDAGTSAISRSRPRWLLPAGAVRAIVGNGGLDEAWLATSRAGLNPRSPVISVRGAMELEPSVEGRPADRRPAVFSEYVVAARRSQWRRSSRLSSGAGLKAVLLPGWRAPPRQ